MSMSEKLLPAPVSPDLPPESSSGFYMRRSSRSPRKDAVRVHPYTRSPVLEPPRFHSSRDSEYHSTVRRAVRLLTNHLHEGISDVNDFHLRRQQMLSFLWGAVKHIRMMFARDLATCAVFERMNNVYGGVMRETVNRTSALFPKQRLEILERIVVAFEEAHQDRLPLNNIQRDMNDSSFRRVTQMLSDVSDEYERKRKAKDIVALLDIFISLIQHFHEEKVCVTPDVVENTPHVWVLHLFREVMGIEVPAEQLMMLALIRDRINREIVYS
jgi:hypothetical protein